MTDQFRECPLCAETMKLVERNTVERVPGTAKEKTTRFFEWVCPECDYFEEKDEEGKKD